MSLIICTQNCRHQNDGYCQLNSVTSLSGSNDAKCGYYEKSDDAQRTGGASDPLTENAHGV